MVLVVNDLTGFVSAVSVRAAKTRLRSVVPPLSIEADASIEFTRGMRCFSHCTLKTEQRGDKEDLSLLFLRTCRLSPRAISTGQLNTLPCLHLRPINQIVSLGPYSLEEMGDLILGGVSRLDAFSVYLVRT